MLKNYSVCLVIIISLIITVFISCNKKEDKVIIITTDDQYLALAKEDTATVTIPLYIEQNKSFYFNKEIIESAYLKNINSDQIYEVEVKNITKTLNTIKYENKDLYEYDLELMFNNCTKEEIRILDCYLELSFNSGEIFKIDIGSILFKQVSENSYLNVSNFKAIVNNVMPYGENTLPTVVGILVKLKNNTNKNITLTSLFALNSLVKVDTDKVKVLSNTSYESNTDINTIIDSPYELLKDKTDGNVNFLVSPNEEISLIIPLNYLKLEIVNESGLIFTYKIDENYYEGMIETIPLFNSTLVMPNYNIYAFTPSSN